ncbi:BlaI/MecI/CopY family transcriptional regulator [Paenibacillus arenosi]|uniref:BlaI/MecI/CopY family transcriptional regulator n=1 Tax=Paenibacillus arenosi TaxID=2774142 RepID=A0ABR9B2B3_9BACL|nr:BlaI/MecI/CopY family transcriptional regulator [Paenibacillus arenosi]MBD8499567.1 BlaI/MecI/CopY family transcriptional regulator [Paenibacillus arenosi]
MQHIPSITDAELEVMRILWTNPDRLSSEIVKIMADRMDWSPNTTRTLLNRLVQKQAVGVKLDNSAKRFQLFYPLVSEQEYLRSETKSFVKKLYGGSWRPMLAHFLEDEKLNTQEIEALKALFDDNGSDKQQEKRDR